MVEHAEDAKTRRAALVRDYDTFYGKDRQVPLSELAAIGDQLAAEAIIATTGATSTAQSPLT